MKQMYPFDFLVGSIHFIGGWAFSHRKQRWDKHDYDVDKLYDKYYTLMLSLINSDLFSGLAHPQSLQCFGAYPQKKFRHIYLQKGTGGTFPPGVPVVPGPAASGDDRQSGREKADHFGLGHYTSKMLCEHHGGWLRVENLYRQELIEERALELNRIQALDAIWGIGRQSAEHVLAETGENNKENKPAKPTAFPVYRN